MDEPESFLIVEGLDVPSVEPQLLDLTTCHYDQHIKGGTGSVCALLHDES